MAILMLLISIGFAMDAKQLSQLIKDVPKSISIKKDELTGKSTGHPDWLNISQNLCVQDELMVSEVENVLLQQFKSHLQNKNLEAFSQLFSEAALADQVFAESEKKFQNLSTVQKHTLNTKKFVKTSAKFNEYSQVLGVEAKISDYTINFDSRDNNYNPKSFEADIRFTMRGLDQQKNRRMDVIQHRAMFTKIAGQWRIEKIRPMSGYAMTTKAKPFFEDKTKDRNLASIPVYARTEAIRRGGYALSMSDINKDGINDMLVGTRDKTILLQGQASGGFKDITQGSGLETVAFAKTAIFADLRNSGTQDLVVVTLRPGDKFTNTGHTSVLVFHGNGRGQFNKIESDFGSKKGLLQPMPATVADFNKDGYLDLYVGYPGIRDFTVLSDQKETVDKQGLYFNDGTGRFKDFTDHFQEKNYSRASQLFPHSAMAVDLDQNGDMDLIVLDDRNNLSPVYLNQGQGFMSNKTEAIGLGNNGYGMSVVSSDFNNDGLTDIAMTNVNFVSARRSFTACDRHWNGGPFNSEYGLRLFNATKNGKFQETTQYSDIIEQTGEGAGGVATLDYNNDGHEDIYLVNGLWSGHKEGDDVSSFFVSLLRLKTASIGWAIRKDILGFKELLQSFEGRILQNGEIINKPGQHINMAGQQYNKLFHNNGDGTFTDVAFFHGVDSLSDGYVVGTQINQDGTEDLILRNGDPGILNDNAYPVQYFKNTTKSLKKAVILSFEGVQTNKDGVGLFAVAHYKNKSKQIKHLVGNTGSMQSDKKIRFVISKGIEQIDLHWPSGTVQHLKNIKPGFFHIKEKPTMTQTSL